MVDDGWNAPSRAGACLGSLTAAGSHYAHWYVSGAAPARRPAGARCGAARTTGAVVTGSGRTWRAPPARFAIVGIRQPHQNPQEPTMTNLADLADLSPFD